MNVQAFLARLTTDKHYRGQVAACRELPSRPAEFAEPRQALSAPLRAMLAQQGIERLYAHQAQALDAVSDREHVVVCTGTASGKSLCYHLPVLDRLAGDRAARALYLFPAKALAHDQLGSLERLIAQAGLGDAVRPACYDGDTPTHRRQGIRREANLLLSNPDMLHQGVLPYHGRWLGLFENLRLVVLDEIHTYRGIFGSHVANVVRRVRRICRLYGSDPLFICCSATLGNPRELAERLTGCPMRLIDQDGSPRGRRWVVLWNPPWLSEVHVARRSGNVEAQELMQALLEAGAGTITFTKARVVAELIYRYVAESLRRRQRPDLASRVRPYRGGYLPLQRRGIEQALFSGELLGVCSTNALELGIDVGTLDAAIVVGFPGTLCSLWQQIGRAGRRQDESLALLVSYDDPIDQYFMRKPDFIFDRPLEHAVVDPQNSHILAAQLSCAAAELPLERTELPEFGPNAAAVAELLVERGRLRAGDREFNYAVSGLPHHETSLRTISNATYAIVDTTGGANEVLGQVDAISAPELVYPQAVYLHQGETYIVRELDEQAHLARVERLDADYYTQPILASHCSIKGQELAGEVHAGRRFFGQVLVEWQTVGFRKFKFHSMELIGQTQQELAPLHIDTMAVWLQPPTAALKAVTAAGHRRGEALSGVRNLLMVVLAPLAMCDRHDLGGIVDSTQLGTPTIFLYDRYEGGVGYARQGYERAEELLRMASELVAGCDCEKGCPGCVGPANLRPPLHQDPDLQGDASIPDKAATDLLLRSWRGQF